MFLTVVVGTVLWLAAVIVATMILYRITELPAKAPLLDLIVGLLIWIPWIVGFYSWGLVGLGAILVGQFIGLQLFTILHTHLSGYRGPKIRTTLDRIVGPTRNHLGLWITLPALPVFVFIRIAELFFYPLLSVTLNFPRYKQAEWVNISRQKFEGLVGHDLVWCLYCDWMTGVYSLGAEMLRNVESFWCPIRFYENKKCENCKVDFPDLKEWVPKEGNMKEVTDLLKEKYGKKSGNKRSWFGHPERRSRKAK